MEMDDLKPCPFCGRRSYVVHEIKGLTHKFYVATDCRPRCHNLTKMVPSYYDTYEDAIDNWNKWCDRWMK